MERKEMERKEMSMLLIKTDVDTGVKCSFILKNVWTGRTTIASLNFVSVHPNFVSEIRKG